MLLSGLMDVFVIPLGRDRYELYNEQPVELDQNTDTSPGLVGRLLKRASAWLRDTEARQHDRVVPSTSRIGRLQDRAFAWVVDRIAEQRLLWNLRGATAATVAHPSDMTFEQVQAVIRGDLQSSHDRHRRWLVIDGILLVLTTVVLGPLFLLIPGVANLPALYFAFRVFGHWLSLRGARQGLDRVAWSGRPCPPLGELRDLASLEPAARHARIQDISARLHLQHLSTFFERIAVTS
jgi:hypothetical protein